MSARVLRHFCLGLLIVSSLAAAPNWEDDKETVQVAVLAILATERNDTVDPKLACIAKQVRVEHKALTGFRMGEMTKKSLVIGAKSSFKLIDDQKAVVTVERGADEKNRVQVRIAPPSMGEITYDTCCGKFLPIVTNYRTKDNELLIFAVCVKTCREK